MANLNDIVGLNTRHGNMDCVIVDTRRVRKGRQAGKMEYEFAPLATDSKMIGFWAIGETFIGKPAKTWTPEQVKEAIARHRSRSDEKADMKEARIEKGREAIGDVDWDKTRATGKTSGQNIGVGDKVLVRYSDIGPKWETVAFVNYKNGKVAITKNIVRQAGQNRDSWITLLLGVGRARNPRDYRYISTSSIIKVEQAE